MQIVASRRADLMTDETPIDLCTAVLGTNST